MFTGIIEEVGIVKELSKKNEFVSIKVECSKVLEETKIGDSISTNGVCLTVIEKGENYFKADIMGETLKRSNFRNCDYGSKVNLERALCFNGRLGGHIVSGHIDGTGEIVSIEDKRDGTWFTIGADKKILKYIIEKGSICIDGISLTVAYVDEKAFKVSIIPHTLKSTSLSDKSINSIVNLECDMVGKYIEKFMIFKEKDDEENKSNVTREFLIENGF
ncbi:MAG: riboflavin synthase [Clostridium butyricum]|nr:riboflavin synthase [Clostridium butyricum]